MNKNIAIRFRRITALALRIFRQFTRDRRSAFLIFFSPIVIMSLVSYLLEGPPSKIPFSLVGDFEGTSVVYDVIRRSLEDEHRVKLVELKREEIQKALEEGIIRGALTVKGGTIDDLTEGRGAELTLYLEGSDAISARELASILEALQKRLIHIVRSDLSPFMDNTSASLTQMQLKVKYLYGGENFTPTDYLAPIILGVFAFVLTFLLTSVSMLREKNSGTMERLLVSPVSMFEIISGYILGFTLFTFIQAFIILFFEIWILKIHYVGNLSLVFLIVALVTLTAGNLGIFLSSLAKTELQVAQFMPLVIIPLILVSGVLWSVDSMPKWLKPLAYISPLTWTNTALRDVMIKGFDLRKIAFSLSLLLLFATIFCVLASLTLRKQVK